MAPRLLDVVVFELAGQRFGLPAHTVRKLLRAVLIRPIPGSPKHVEGVVNLRGEVVPVIDVRTWLGLPHKPLEPSDHFLVVTAGEGQVVLRVDRAVELLPLEAGAVVPSVGGALVTKSRDGLVLLPDVQALLAGGNEGWAQPGVMTGEGPP